MTIRFLALPIVSKKYQIMQLLNTNWMLTDLTTGEEFGKRLFLIRKSKLNDVINGINCIFVTRRLDDVKGKSLWVYHFTL